MANSPAETLLGTRLGLHRSGLRPGDKAVVFFSGLIALLILVNFTQVPNATIHLVVDGILVGLAFLLARKPLRDGRNGRFGMLARGWFPMVAIPLLFGQLPDLIPAMGILDKDPILIRLDQTLFGCQPSILLARLHVPFLTDLLQVVYTSFYFFPVVLAVRMILKRRRGQFDYLMFLVCYGFFLSYLGYLLVPAIGPRFCIRSLYPFPLSGLGLYECLSSLLNKLEQINRDCFPSGHTMMTVVSVWHAWQVDRPIFRFLLLPGTILVFSTLYLRYHYAVDVLGGIAFAAFTVWSAPILYRMLVSRRNT